MFQGNLYRIREEEKKRREEYVKKYLEEIVLRLILSSGGIHPYKFKKYVENKENFGIWLSSSQVYPIFWSLEKRNIITSRIERDGKRKKVVYKPIPFKTRKYLERHRNIHNKVRSKINKISPEYLTFQISEPLEEIKE